MSVLNLETFRAERAVAQRHAEAYVHGLARHILIASLAQAERGFAVASQLRESDPELARGIYRYLLRRLRAEVRKKIGAEAWRDDAVRIASDLYTGRLLALIDERDRRSA